MLRNESTFPSCVRCGGRLARQYVRQGVLERLASVARVYPFQCEGCAHRFHALMWREWRLEWDDQFLVMPDRDYRPSVGREWSGEFYKFAAIFCLLGILIVIGIVWLTHNFPDYRSVIMDLQKGFVLQPSEPKGKQ